MTLRIPFVATLAALIAVSAVSSARAPKSTTAARTRAPSSRLSSEQQQLARLSTSLRSRLKAGPSQLRRTARTPLVQKNIRQRTPVKVTDPAKGGGGVSLPAQMDVTGWSPEQQGQSGTPLELVGYGLPVNGVDVYLGNTVLERISSSSSNIKVRLPNSATSGALKVKRLADGAWGTLDSSYQVLATPPAPAFSYFNRSASSHHAVNAYLLSVLSWYAYDDQVGATTAAQWETNVKALLPGLGLPKVECFDKNSPVVSTQGCVASNPQIVVVFLRGTQTNLQDWATDLAVLPIPMSAWGKNVMVHPGFLNGVNATWGELLSSVLQMRDNNQKVWVTGHSLGGALATLAAFRLEHEKGIPVKGVYTYGAPAVGNSAFRTAYHARGINHQRYTVERDIVPAFPPSVALSGGYAHVGNLVGISLSGTINPSATNESTLSADKHFEPYHYEYPKDLRAAITPSTLREAMPEDPSQ